MEGLTATDVEEREDALRRLEATVVGNHLFHESIDPRKPTRFTRRWFSWRTCSTSKSSSPLRAPPCPADRAPTNDGAGKMGGGGFRRSENRQLIRDLASQDRCVA
jgi:glycosyl hydrolase family 125 (putative metal-dependent alpha-mannosidase)